MEIAEGGVKARRRKSRMIPKSGFRFSEKIMRQEKSKKEKSQKNARTGRGDDRSGRVPWEANST
jgi:hypothetical protein